MTDRVDQLVFAFNDQVGMVSIVSSSLRNGDVDAWDGWDHKLRQHSRLLSSAEGTPPPSTSFSHLAFADGTAAVLRRSARPGDSGRNVAHALVGDRTALAAAAPRLICWADWLDDAPVSGRLPAESLAQLAPDAVPHELNDPLLIPILAAVLARPDGAFSIIGVPDELRLPALWRTRTLARHAGSEWTFSTYEETDRHKLNLPRFIFLAERPRDVIPQAGRMRIDVGDEVRYTDHYVRQAIALVEGHQAAPVREAREMPEEREEPATAVLEVVPSVASPAREQEAPAVEPVQRSATAAEPAAREPLPWPDSGTEPAQHEPVPWPTTSPAPQDPLQHPAATGPAQHEPKPWPTTNPAPQDPPQHSAAIGPAQHEPPPWPTTNPAPQDPLQHPAATGPAHHEPTPWPAATTNPAPHEPARQPAPIHHEPTPWPAFTADPALHQILHGNAPLATRLLQFAHRLESLNGDLRHEPLAEWIEHADVPDPFIAVLIDHLRTSGRGGFEQALAGRFLARQGVGREPEHPAAAPPTPRRAADLEVARLVWGKQLAWSAAASRHKAKAVRLRWFVLTMLVGGAVGAVVVPQVNDRLLSWAGSMIAAVIALGVFTGTWVRTTQEPQARRKWTHARNVSEKLKAEVCRYLAGAAPYRDAGAVQLLRDEVEEIEGGDPKVAAAMYPPPIRDLRSYVEYRIHDQIRHHARTGAVYERRLRNARVAEFVLGAMAAVLAAAGVEFSGDVAVWAGVLTGTAGAITAHIAQTGYEHLVARYRRTVKELRQLLDTLPETPDPAAMDAFVAECELVLAQQNADWLAQLMPATKGQP